MEGQGRGMHKPISVAVVSHNTRELTLRCLAAVERAADGLSAALAVVDTGSADGTVDAVRTAFPAWRVLVEPDNPGYGIALNHAFRSAPAGYYLALNADVAIDVSALRRLSEVLDTHATCGLVGPALRYPDGRRQDSAKRTQSLPLAIGEVLGLHALFPGNPWLRRFYYHDRELGQTQEVEAISGAAMLIRGSAYDRLGGFDEGFRLYFEETDLCIRLRETGYSVMYCPEATAVHAHGASTSQTTMRQIEYYVSYIRFMRKHRGPLAARIFTAAVALHGVLRAVALFAKYPPYSKSQRAILGPKLEACTKLLKTLVSPSAVEQAAGVRL